MFFHSFIHSLKAYESTIWASGMLETIKCGPCFFLSLFRPVLDISVLCLLHWLTPPPCPKKIPWSQPSCQGSPMWYHVTLPYSPGWLDLGWAPHPEQPSNWLTQCDLVVKYGLYQSDLCSWNFELENMERCRQSRSVSYEADLRLSWNHGWLKWCVSWNHGEEAIKEQGIPWWANRQNIFPHNVKIFWMSHPQVET